ncbi:MAG TPA: type II toxin-antitoxin system Phd/YefM family antitoxin [Planctomycetota bacterium]|nr:type II toxin-antitoxin system Phd/YefM family antitoxin [Planctomycetota bacterium]
MTRVPLHKIKDRLSEYVDKAAGRQFVITRHGRPAAVLIGFLDEDDWFEYRLLNDPRFLKRIRQSRRQAATGKTVRLEDLPD